MQAQTSWYVNDTSTSGDIYTTAIGNNANAGTSASAPKLTLDAAFTAAAAGDIIYVDKGTFTGTGNRALTLSKAITIIGAGTGNTIFTSHSDHRFATISANNVSIQNLQLFDFFLYNNISSIFFSTSLQFAPDLIKLKLVPTASMLILILTLLKLVHKSVGFILVSPY
jgi:hypothetical protein